jgi:ABC-type transporter Mla MlaB component
MKNNILDIIKNRRGEPSKAVLSIDDELSFINATPIITEIRKHMDEFDELQIQANLVHLDLTGVQLLYSIKRSFENVNKKVAFNIKLGDELKTLILRSGFKELFEIH